jgi:hypothetical protein
MKNLRTSLMLLLICLSIPINAQIINNCNGAVNIGDGGGTLHYGNYGLVIRYTSGDRALLELQSPDGSNRTIFQSLSYGSYLGTMDQYQPLFLQTSGGLVGIGTIYPQYTLDVNGDIHTSGYLYESSDERFKENIKPLKNCLQNIIKVNGKQYTKVITKNTTLNMDSIIPSEIGKNIVKEDGYGVIAQEMEKIFPELVKADSSGLLSINYIGLIPVLIEAVKELNTKTEVVQQLKTTNDSLINAIKSLKNSNQQLEQRIGIVEADMKTCCSSSNTKGANIISDIKTTDLMQNFLSQNMPNPFSQQTEIKYYINENYQKAMINIYDMQGTQKKSYPVITRGNSSLTINGFELRAGMYLYTLIVDGKEIDTKRMILTD